MSAAFALPPVPGFSSARPRRRFNDFFALGIVASAVFHLVLLAYFPDLSVADFSRDSGELPSLDIVPIVAVPPPPDAILRPAIPLLSTSLDPTLDVSIAPMVFGQTPPATPPMPAIDRTQDAGISGVFTPFEIAPVLQNREEYARTLQQRYPANLRNAGIGGTVMLRIHLDEGGVVLEAQVEGSSGYSQLDAVAVQLIREVARFRPAVNRDLPVAVWINLPVVFQTQ